jgi:hypothetical protein
MGGERSADGRCWLSCLFSQVVKDLMKAHVLSRPLSAQPMDPTAWYRLSNTHRDEMALCYGRRPPVTDADAPILADLARAMRFANGAYGLAADQMVTVTSNLKMHASRATGGVDFKDGVDASLNTQALCRLAVRLFVRVCLCARAPCAVSRAWAFPSCTRSILTEIYLCHACPCHEILRMETPARWWC